MHHIEEKAKKYWNLDLKLIKTETIGHKTYYYFEDKDGLIHIGL